METPPPQPPLFRRGEGGARLQQIERKQLLVFLFLTREILLLRIYSPSVFWPRERSRQRLFCVIVAAAAAKIGTATARIIISLWMRPCFRMDGGYESEGSRRREEGEYKLSLLLCLCCIHFAIECHLCL